MLTWLITILALILIGITGYFWYIKKAIATKDNVKKSVERKLFLITLPKELKEEDKNKQIKELIAPTEILLRNLHSIKDSLKNEYITLELIAQGGTIGFYMSVPGHLKDLLEKQITAQYPEAVVEEVIDPNIFPHTGQIAAAQIKLKKESVYPIVTYPNFEGDALDALTNALSKLNSDTEGAAVQIIIRPASDGWQKRGQTLASMLQQGKGSGGSIGEGILSGFRDLASVNNKKDDKKDETKKLTPGEENIIEAISAKTSKVGFSTLIRIVTASSTKEEAQINLNNILSSFHQYASPQLNRFTLDKLPENKIISQLIFRLFNLGKTFTLNTEEIATLWHLPSAYLDTPNIKWQRAKRFAAPNNLPKEGTILGKNLYRGIENIVRIQDSDRRYHLYCIGKTGTGKTTWMQNMAIQDILKGNGVCVIDPHGDMIDWLLARIPKERAEDVIHFYPPDLERPVGLNLLDAKTPAEKDMAVAEMISIFYKLFDPTGTNQIIGPMFEHYMRNAMLALLADDETGATLIEIPRMFTDKEFRETKLQKVTDPAVRQFWLQEYAQSQRGQQSADMLSYVVSKIGRFLSNEMMRNIIGQKNSAFNMRDVMDNKKILLVNLAKGLTGEINSNLLGFILVSKIQMAALSRADIPEAEREDFYLYIDEFQNVTTDSISTILSEARKYHLNLTVAHQFVAQLEEKIRDAVIGNVGTTVSFRIGAGDTDIIQKEFDPEVSANDLLNIENRNAYIKLLIDGAGSKPFNFSTLPPMGEANPKLATALRNLSRLKYGRDRRIVDSEIRERGKFLDNLTDLNNLDNLTK
ncbi:type IV secretory system conjugative DNA transfer family protein [Patescibacteria group bacterium]|nr:type IV secretory system conjugative DNA transfer family protein [Patescibacteria group bacterium]